MISRAILLGAATLASISPAAAEPDLLLMAKANGLAEIMIGAEQCDYEIDQARLDSYFAEQGLDTPEILTFISNTVTLDEFGGSAKSPSQCTIAKATARKLDLLVP